MDSPAVRFCQRLRSIAKLFRFVELFVVLAFLLWLSTRLPFAVRISGHYCRRFSAFILSPIPVFLLGNAIVLALLTKSGLFSGEASATIDNAVADLYEELRSGNPDDAIPALEEEIVYQDKEIICEEVTKIASSKAACDRDDDDDGQNVDVSDKKQQQPEVVKTSYRRSQSENLRRESEEMEEKSKQKLRRSETDIRWKDLAGGDATAEELPEDDMSNEEFQRTIEAFIAKQIRFHRQERLAVVLHGQA